LLPQRVGGDERLQAGQRLGGAAGGEQAPVARLRRLQPGLLQPDPLGGGDLGAGELGVRRPAPQGQRLAEQWQRLPVGDAAGGGDQGVEAAGGGGTRGGGGAGARAGGG